MTQLHRLSIEDLQPAERTEVEQTMKTVHRPRQEPRARAGFLADNHDVVVIWLMMLFAGVGGIVVYFVGGIPVPYAGSVLGLVGVMLIGWTISIVVRTLGKRGCLYTAFGTYEVRGDRLKGVRHADVKEIKTTTLRNKGGRFTVFELVTKDGGKLTLYAHGGWAADAIAAIQQVNGATSVSEG